MNIRTLCSVGNSAALIIDKPTRRLLGIGHNTKLRVMTDGRRLIVEPITEQPPAPTASELDAPAVFAALVERFGMSQAHFNQLHHQKMRMFAYRGWLESLAKRWTDADRATVRRFETGLRTLKQGASWNDAITVALHTEPKAGQPSVSPAVPHAATADDPNGTARQDKSQSATADEPRVDESHPATADGPRVDESLYRDDLDEENPVEGVWLPLD